MWTLHVPRVALRDVQAFCALVLLLLAWEWDFSRLSFTPLTLLLEEGKLEQLLVLPRLVTLDPIHHEPFPPTPLPDSSGKIILLLSIMKFLDIGSTAFDTPLVQKGIPSLPFGAED